MWLPVDERRLLAGYYQNIGDVDVQEAYEIEELRKLLSRWTKYGRCICSYEESRSAEAETDVTLKEQLRANKRNIADAKRIRKATKHLGLHGLVVEQTHQHADNVLVVSLTLEGFDLGRRYANWFDRSGLCFQEYRHHWLWLVLAFFGGALISSAIQNLFWDK